MVVVMAAFPFLVSIKPIFPRDALVVNSHGHNDEVRQALDAANLPYLSIAGGASANAPTFTSFLWAYADISRLPSPSSFFYSFSSNHCYDRRRAPNHAMEPTTGRRTPKFF
jgi:hypothetical protein